MNERIKELIKQSTTTKIHGMGEIDTLDSEKLAKLIILECIDQCDHNGSNDEWDRAVRWSANQIKEHFGLNNETN